MGAGTFSFAVKNGNYNLFSRIGAAMQCFSGNCGLWWDCDDRMCRICGQWRAPCRNYTQSATIQRGVVM